MAQRVASQPEKRTIQVFIASPGDLAEERRTFKKVLDKLNDGFADGAGVKFVSLGWEDTIGSTGRRAQGVINQEIDRCDVFVLAMYRRWGQEAPDAKPHSSYTEEEFYRAYDRWKKTASPEIYVFFKHIDPGESASPGEDLKKVLAFRKSLEESQKVLYHEFASPRDARLLRKRKLSDLLDWHLREYVKRNMAKSEIIEESNGQPHSPSLPLYVDAGTANPDLIRDLFLAIEAVYKAHGWRG